MRGVQRKLLLHDKAKMIMKSSQQKITLGYGGVGVARGELAFSPLNNGKKH